MMIILLLNFYKFYKKKMTENAILDNNKGKYMDLFNELQRVTMIFTI